MATKMTSKYYEICSVGILPAYCSGIKSLNRYSYYTEQKHRLQTLVLLSFFMSWIQRSKMFLHDYPSTSQVWHIKMLIRQQQDFAQVYLRLQFCSCSLDVHFSTTHHLKKHIREFGRTSNLLHNRRLINIQKKYVVICQYFIRVLDIKRGWKHPNFQAFELDREGRAERCTTHREKCDISSRWTKSALFSFVAHPLHHCSLSLFGFCL